MKLFVYLFFTTIPIWIGCSEPKKEDVRKVKYDIPFDGMVQNIGVEQIFKNIRYLPLETKDSSLLGRVKRVVFKNGYVYVSDYKNMLAEITVFGENGQYVQKIGRKGEGPEDYLFFPNFNIDALGNISLLDNFRNSIVTYSSDNEFISRIKVDSVPLLDLAYLNDSLLLVRSIFRDNGYKFYVVNTSKKEVVNYYCPVSKRNLTCTYDYCFTTYGNRVLTCEAQSTEIVEVSKDSMSVRYIFNVGNKMPPSGFWDRDVPYYVLGDEYDEKGYIAHIPCFAEGDNSMLLRFDGRASGTSGFAYIEKATSQSIIFNRIILADGVIIKPTFFFSRGDGKITFLVMPSDILESGNAEFISRFPGLVEDSNPILLLAEIK